MSQIATNKYPKYPAYKDSGVEWLGEIPEHWELKMKEWRNGGMEEWRNGGMEEWRNEGMKE